MSDSIILDENITVKRPLHEVFAYVSEFSRIEEWDPAVARATKLTSGAPGVGSEYRPNPPICASALGLPGTPGAEYRRPL